MSTDVAVRCPNCGVPLPATGLAPGLLVQCSQCNHQFYLGTRAPTAPVTSGKATASLVLGLIPIPILTGLPAIVLGIWALIDIRRRPALVSGSGLAVCGILFGFLCSFVCTPMVGTAMWYGSRIARESNFTSNADEIAEIASGIAELDVPDELPAVLGADTGFLGWKMVLYGGGPQGNSNSVLILMKFPNWMAGSQQEMEQQIEQQAQMHRPNNSAVEETRILKYTIRNQQVEVTEGIGKDQSTGRTTRQYMAMLPGSDSPVIVMLMTEDPGENEESPPGMPEPIQFSEERVKQIFESIR